MLASTKIAYVLLVHKNPSQFARLVHVLDSPMAEMFVHVDAKSAIVAFERAGRQAAGENLHFIKKRTAIHHGGFSIVVATLDLLEAVLTTRKQFSHIILMSGQDYPIRRSDEIARHFRASIGSEFLQYVPLPCADWDVMCRIEQYFLFETLGRRLDAHVRRWLNRILPKRKFPEGYRPFGGNQWWCITPECAEFIVSFVERQKGFVQFFRHTLIPDELFFHTIVLNSHFRERVINDHLRYIDWQTGPQRPRILTVEDYQKLVDCKKLFARKFDPEVDTRILDLLDNTILENSLAGSNV